MCGTIHASLFVLHCSGNDEISYCFSSRLSAHVGCAELSAPVWASWEHFCNFSEKYNLICSFQLQVHARANSFQLQFCYCFLSGFMTPHWHRHVLILGAVPARPMARQLTSSPIRRRFTPCFFRALRASAAVMSVRLSLAGMCVLGQNTILDDLSGFSNILYRNRMRFDKS